MDDLKEEVENANVEGWDTAKQNVFTVSPVVVDEQEHAPTWKPLVGDEALDYYLQELVRLAYSGTDATSNDLDEVRNELKEASTNLATRCTATTFRCTTRPFQTPHSRPWCDHSP